MGGEIDLMKEHLASIPVCQAVLDERTCEACAWFDGTDAVPPHDDCTSKDGCRCHLVIKGE